MVWQKLLGITMAVNRNLCIFVIQLISVTVGLDAQNAVVTTNPEITLQAGREGVLKCVVDRKLYTVYWNKGQTEETAENMVILDLYQFAGSRSGKAYGKGYNISDDLSFIIEKVTVADEGLYFCAVADFETGRLFVNQTRVKVVAGPTEPYPTSPNCTSLEPTGAFNYRCDIQLMSGTTSNISCTVTWFYPDATVAIYHNGAKITPNTVETAQNDDGTKNKTVAITVAVDSSPYVCVVNDLPDGQMTRALEMNMVYFPLHHEPFYPAVDFPFSPQCPSTSQHPGSTHAQCVVRIDPSSEANVTCGVPFYNPVISVDFVYDGLKLVPKDSKIDTNPDGTKTKSITIVTSARSKPFHCVVADIPNSTSRTLEIFVTSTADNGQPPSATVWLLVLGVVLIISVIAGVIFLIGCVRSTTHNKDPANCQPEFQKDEKGVYIVPEDYTGFRLDDCGVSSTLKHILKKVLIPKDTIKKRIHALAEEIWKDIDHSLPLTIIFVLKGSNRFRFMSDLLNEIHEIRWKEDDPLCLRFEYMKIKFSDVPEPSFFDLDNLHEKNVLIIDDVIASGQTAHGVREIVKRYNPKSLKVCSLLIKRNTGIQTLIPDFCGFEIPNKYIVGYVFGWKDDFNNLEHICDLNEEAVGRPV